MALQPAVQCGLALFLQGQSVNHSLIHSLFSTEVKERVELYLYFPSGPS